MRYPVTLIFLLLVSFILNCCDCGNDDDDDGRSLDTEDDDAELPDDDSDDDLSDDDTHDPAYNVMAMDIDNNTQAIWMGTPDGLVSYDMELKSISRYNADSSGLASNEIETVMVDDAGNVWIGYGHGYCSAEKSSFCGVTVFTEQQDQWTTYSSGNSDIIDDRTFAISQAPDGEIWIGTHTGAAIKYTDHWGAYFDWHDCANPGDHCNPIWSYRPTDFAFLSDGTTWLAINLFSIGTHPKPGGVARRSATGLTDTWDMDDGLPSNVAEDIVASVDAVYASSSHGVSVFEPANNIWSTISNAEVTDLELDSDGRLWISAKDGIRTYNGSVVSIWLENEGLPHSQVNCLLIVNTTLCFGTVEGLGCYDRQTQTWDYPLAAQ